MAKILQPFEHLLGLVSFHLNTASNLEIFSSISTLDNSTAPSNSFNIFSDDLLIFKGIESASRVDNFSSDFCSQYSRTQYLILQIGKSLSEFGISIVCIFCRVCSSFPLQNTVHRRALYQSFQKLILQICSPRYAQTALLLIPQRLRLKISAFLLGSSGSLARRNPFPRLNKRSAICTDFPPGAAQRSNTRSHFCTLSTCAERPAATSCT